MANTRISMNLLRQIISLKKKGLSNRAISRQLGTSRKTVNKYVSHLEATEIPHQELLNLADQDLSAVSAPSQDPSDGERDYLRELYASFPKLEKELKRTGVTRHLLWQEYKRAHPEGISYTRFCEHFRRYRKTQEITMPLQHKAGDKLFIDFTGKKPMLTCPETGELKPVEAFVSVLGASGYTYLEVIENQQTVSYLPALIHNFAFLEGVPAAVVPDNFKGAVTRSSRYEPHLNDSLQDFALHYGCTILPTRAYKPRDKALVENAVRLVYSQIFAPLRNQVFHTLTELNQAIAPLLEAYNNRPLKGRTYSRRQLFEELDRPALQPLPLDAYEYKQYAKATVYKTSHVWLGEDKHYYSVPFRYIGKKVKIAYTSRTVEIYQGHQRIALHVREKGPYRYTSLPEHLPSTHRFISEWHPDKFIGWADGIGVHTGRYIRGVLERKPHPEQGYKSCLGILSLAKKVGRERLEKACERGAYYQSYSYRVIKNILIRGLDGETFEQNQELSAQLSIFHENLRGGDYYR